MYNQRVLFDLAKELHELGWHDKDVWMLIFKTAVDKKKINNVYDFDLIFNIMHEINEVDQLKGKV